MDLGGKITKRSHFQHMHFEDLRFVAAGLGCAHKCEITRPHPILPINQDRRVRPRFPRSAVADQVANPPRKNGIGAGFTDPVMLVRVTQIALVRSNVRLRCNG